MKLNQVIAVEKGIKAKAQSDVDAIFKAAQKPSLFDGFVKTYRKKREDDEDVPTQQQVVQMNAELALSQIADRWVGLFDVTAQKDYANCGSRADVVVDELVVLKDVPVTYLLFLEKQLTDLFTIVSKFPTLDPAQRWLTDTSSGQHYTSPEFTTRTKKVQRPLVLYPHSTEHPAQTQLITEDVSVGTYEHVRYSGAIPEPRQRELLGRIAELQRAVKVAREQANMIDAPEKAVGRSLFGWLFR